MECAGIFCIYVFLYIHKKCCFSLVYGLFADFYCELPIEMTHTG